jgi:chloramphenicol O-acetyltransferase type A
MPTRRLDLDRWPRRDHFHFFRSYDQPFFNLCADVAVAPLVRWCRAPGRPSFFIASLHASLRAANEVEEFHYRIRGGEVLIHEVVHGGSTILRGDETFGFAYFEFDPDLDTFARSAHQVLRSARRDGELDARDDRDDLIHYSVIPWLSFTSFSHARRRLPDDSTPKIVFGRYHGDPGTERMPVSVEVHHALMDALHVGRFYERFQIHIDAFETASHVT